MRKKFTPQNIQREWQRNSALRTTAKLGLKRTRLIHKMKKVGIPRPPLASREHVPEAAPRDANAQLQL